MYIQLHIDMHTNICIHIQYVHTITYRHAHKHICIHIQYVHTITYRHAHKHMYTYTICTYNYI